jgi:hypothetical protein
VSEIGLAAEQLHPFAFDLAVGWTNSGSTLPTWNLRPSIRGSGDRRFPLRVRPLPVDPKLAQVRLLGVLAVPFYVVAQRLLGSVPKKEYAQTKGRYRPLLLEYLALAPGGQGPAFR